MNGVVYAVQYGPGEPDGTYTLCLCATRSRAETELNWYVTDEGFNPDQVFIEELEVLE